ncbi:ribosomal protein S5 domain 2-like protein [Rhizoclosmatium globosum]|uniref:Ribosomal protein S5 domain 2-like protein n=1 Tax=Rhizoclosmatium globosum TaxID=329046 RepID=A0A1Y2CIV9_9FUNG|nr:ribosomal protein S5 domain 2-like protein [Rhizoclosmatium globosum]|eukprot:ORY46847.1 ribosomal protein S5 domain 2-like protein [Rhizoclosmatium globosum]
MLIVFQCYSSSASTPIDSLTHLPLFLSIYPLLVVCDASSFAVAQRWTALVKLEVSNVGSCASGASLQRVTESLVAALSHKLNDGNGVLILPTDLSEEIDWDFIERTVSVAKDTTGSSIRVIEDKEETSTLSKQRTRAFFVSGLIRENLYSTLDALQLSSRVSDMDEDAWTQAASFVTGLKTLNVDELHVIHHTHAVSVEALNQSSVPTVASAYARIGLLGNPSDGFYGKTISLLIKNFKATVTLTPNPSPSDQTISIHQTPLLDPFQFASIAQLSASCEKNGYYGVQRLMLAAAKVFGVYCRDLGIHSVEGGVLRGFSVDYETNIPRQVGLAGSSALITAFLRALILYYGLDNHPAFPPHIRANLALQAEKDELDIASGLQDRVIQAYGGLVYMDFNKPHMESHNHGIYTRLPLSHAPPNLWIAYVGVPSDSGKIHNTIRQRFVQGDPVVHAAMEKFAGIAKSGREALERGEWRRVAELMDENFDTRRGLYGDEVVGS